MSNTNAKNFKDRYPLGTIVRVRPERVDDWVSSISSKIRDRLGEVVSHSFPYDMPIVNFRAIGRKSEYRHRFDYPDKNLEIVTDLEEIAAWKKETEATANRLNAKLAARSKARQ